jgi:thioesterase domain-containing protein
MAAHYVGRLRSVQPHGPYVLAGLCAGGVIAFEMARQLQHQGETIGTVVLIDANDAAARKRTGRFALGQVRRFWTQLVQRGSGSQPLESIKGLFGFAGDIVRLGTHQLSSRFAGVLNNRKARRLRRCLDEGQVPSSSLRRLTVDQIYTFAEQDHVDPGPLNADVLLIRATQGNGDIGDEPYMNLYADPLLGWGRRVRGKVNAFDIPGGHYSMFQEPNVKAMAERIQAHIDAVPPR